MYHHFYLRAFCTCEELVVPVPIVVSSPSCGYHLRTINLFGDDVVYFVSAVIVSEKLNHRTNPSS
jgi:hypothetical protein